MVASREEKIKPAITCLHDLPMFVGLDAPTFANVCINAQKLLLPKGGYLFRQGEQLNTIYLIKTGKVKLVQVTVDGREIILDIFGPGDLLGETALFRQQKAAYSAVTLEHSGVCSFGRRELEVMITQSPSLAVKIISILGEKLHSAELQKEEVVGIPVKSKLLRLLLRLADRHGEANGNVTIIKLSLTQQELSDMVGASRVMVVHALETLKATGILERRGKFYVLKNGSGVNNLTAMEGEM